MSDASNGPTLADLAIAQQRREQAAAEALQGEAAQKEAAKRKVAANWVTIRDAFPKIKADINAELAAAKISLEGSAKQPSDLGIVGRIEVYVKRPAQDISSQSATVNFHDTGHIHASWRIPTAKVVAPSDMNGISITPDILEQFFRKFLAVAFSV